MEHDEFMISNGDTLGHEVLFHKLGIFLKRDIHVLKNYTLLRERLLDTMIDNARVELCTNTTKIVTLRFGDTKLLKCVRDLFGELFPVIGLLYTRIDIIGHAIKIETREIGTPIGHWCFLPKFERLEAKFEHPLRFVLCLRNVTNKRLVGANKGDIFVALCHLLWSSLYY